MRLSNKSTFSLVCLIALFVLAAMPAMAQTIEATWTADLNDDNTADDPGWNVTIDGLTAADNVDITYLDVNGAAAAAAGTQTGFADVAADATSTTGTIAANIGTQIAVQVAAGASGSEVTYQRVTFPVAGPGARVGAEEDDDATADVDESVVVLSLLPKLKKLAVTQYYVTFGDSVTVTFDFADAVADTNDDPVADLHVSDVTLSAAGSWQYVSVSGSNMITYRSAHAADATSVETTATLGTTYAQEADTAADGVPTITYDNTAPTVTAGSVAIAAPSGFPTPADSVWDSVFILTFSASDDPDPGSGLSEEMPARIDTDETKLEVGIVGLGTNDDTVTGTEYLVRITPKAGRDTTAGEEIVITIVPIDKAGNEGMSSTTVKLAANTPPAARFVSAAPASGNVRQGGAITVTFDKNPGNLIATNVTVSGSGNTRTLTVSGTQAAGALSTSLTWDNGGGPQVLNYTVIILDDPAIEFSSAAPASNGNVMAGGTVTLTFAADPGTVTSSLGAITGTGATRTLTIPDDQAAGEVTITISWTMAGREDGSQMLTYTVTRDSNPTSPSNIMLVEIPANSYVVLVRAESDTEGALKFPDVPPVNGDPVDVQVWSDMPDLHDLFLRSAQNRGGALVLRKSANASDNDMQDEDGNNIGSLATPAVGTVGISEIMWARDLRNGTPAEQAAGQWIELQNLNSKPVRVLIYAQKGADGLVSGGVLVNTAAGDSLLGNPGGMVIDAIQNIRNDGNQAAGGWDVKGKEGNSVTGEPFASMHRILPDKKSKYENADGSRYNNRKGTNGGHWAESGGAYVRGQTTHTSGGVTNVPLLFDYRGTPGDVNNRTGIQLHTPAGRTNVPANSVVFNEIANLNNADYNWIELRNVTGNEINLRNYLISIVTGVGTDKVLYQFPANDNAKIPANGVFLLVATDPRDVHAQPSVHPLAIGYNVDKNPEDQIRGLGDNPPRYKVVGPLTYPANNSNFVLILRRPDNHEGHRSGQDGGKGVAETGENDLDKIVDIAGYHPNLTKDNYPNPVSSTKMWPLQGFGRGPQFDRNRFDKNTVHYRARHSTHDGLAGAGAHENVNDGRAAFQNAGYTGIGYKRQAASSNVNGGSPGYHGIENGRTASGAKLVISEIMLNQGEGRRSLPQWIEIHNPTDKAINLSADSGWRIVIEEERIALRTINFKAKGSVKWVQPNQTVLVVSGSARDLGSDYLPASVVFPATRVFNVFRELKDHFSMTNATDPFLNTNSFNLKLIDGQGNTSDEIGNLDGNVRTSDTAKWEFSKDTITKDGLRTSLIRVTDEGVARNGLSIDESNVLPLGAKQIDDMVNLARHQIPMKYSWVRASQADLGIINIRHTWYGSEEDYGTPLHREGAVLPVQLSSFRPALEDGKVVIRWTTESELDNAGFNIYRSESRNGEFTQVNEQLIQGNGTTAERSNYKWVDTSAKPGVAYFYQIEDVSFAGERQTLRTTKMKGLISAENKLTTKWGELKEVQ